MTIHNNNAPTRVITAAANEVIDGRIICTKDIVNEHARIRYALNEAAKCVARCPEVLIVDAIYKTNIYKFLLISAIGINNVSNEKATLVPFQIAMAWVEDETEASYTWFLQTLRTEIYNTYDAVCMAYSKIKLKANCHKLFKTDDDYEVFKKEVVNLRFTTVEEQISQSLSAVKKALKKAHIPKKYCNMGISTTGRCESSHSAFKRAIETANNLDSVFHQIDQTMRLQHLKASMRTGSNKVAIDPFIYRDPRFNIYENNGTCECSNKINFTLPCQHMISKDRTISLSMIDKRWFLERPDIIELPRPSKSSIIDLEFYSTFAKAEEKFEQLPDSAAKMEFITKLRQITDMLLPKPAKLPQKVVSKKGSLSSTKRGSLLTEHQDTVMKKKKKMLVNITKLKNKPVNIPKFMHQDIFAYFDVADDSNCSFRTIAISIEKPEGFWPDVRVYIYKELCSRKSHYIQLFLEKEKEYDEVLQATQWKTGPCNSDHWMFMPSFGYVIANTFQRPIHYFSKLISLTFLPDNIPLNQNTSITFAYIFEKQHFIAIKLKPNMPVPPIVKG
ncbi:14497_t:CDS:2 [Gigaspora margarita]|uniref:14497_t:CDS:1 n=1 Tax=Gigaspora margarita TaxID=4874 RepID=A0ABN7VG94_GIGMA|nr:14497_t:CDS:2 [Gigaspora margarita]